MVLEPGFSDHELVHPLVPLLDFRKFGHEMTLRRADIKMNA
jgi:hypothetical protein